MKPLSLGRQMGKTAVIAAVWAATPPARRARTGVVGPDGTYVYEAAQAAWVRVPPPPQGKGS